MQNRRGNATSACRVTSPPVEADGTASRAFPLLKLKVMNTTFDVQLITKLAHFQQWATILEFLEGTAEVDSSQQFPEVTGVKSRKNPLIHERGTHC